MQCNHEDGNAFMNEATRFTKCQLHGCDGTSLYRVHDAEVAILQSPIRAASREQ